MSRDRAAAACRPTPRRPVLSGVEAVTALCRFGHDAAALLLWGAAAYVVALLPAGLRGEVTHFLHGFRIGAVGMVVATTLAMLPLEAAAVGEGWRDAVDLATLRAVLTETSVGLAWQAQACAALLLAASLVVPGRWRWRWTAAASGVVVASLALTGHAAMHEGWRGLAQRCNDAGHVLAAGAWIGALLPVLPVVCALDGLEGRHQDAGLALRRFSNAGHVAVALVIASGALNTALVLGRWPSDWTSPYQAMLASKIAVVAAMTGLAIVNRYFVVPRMRRGRPWVGVVRLAVLVEIGLGLAAVACVSLFGLWDPV